MAPKAWLLNYRIFYDSGYTSSAAFAGDTQVLQAFEDLAADGARVVSNSWGGDAFLNSHDILDDAIVSLHLAFWSSNLFATSSCRKGWSTLGSWSCSLLEMQGPPG